MRIQGLAWLAALHHYLASAANSTKSIDHAGIVIEWLNVFARQGRKQELVVGLFKRSKWGPCFQ